MPGRFDLYSDLLADIGGTPAPPSVPSVPRVGSSPKPDRFAPYADLLADLDQPAEAPGLLDSVKSYLTPSLGTRLTGPIIGGFAGGAVGSIVPGIGTALGAAAGAALGGAAGEGAGQLLDGTPLNRDEIGLAAGLSSLPSGPAQKLAMGAKSLAGKAGWQVAEGIGQGAADAVGSSLYRTGSMPSVPELGTGMVAGGVLGGVLGTGMQALSTPRAPVQQPNLGTILPTSPTATVTPVQPPPPSTPPVVDTPRTWSVAPDGAIVETTQAQPHAPVQDRDFVVEEPAAPLPPVQITPEIEARLLDAGWSPEMVARITQEDLDRLAAWAPQEVSPSVLPVPPVQTSEVGSSGPIPPSVGVGAAGDPVVAPTPNPLPKQPDAPEQPLPAPPGVDPVQWASYLESRSRELYSPEYEKLKAELTRQYGGSLKKIMPVDRARLNALRPDWRRVPEPPNDEAGNPIIPGQETWSPEERTMARQHAAGILKGIDLAQAGNKVGATRIMAGQRSNDVEYLGITSHKNGTAFEGLPYTPGEMKRALKVDKGNPIEQDVLQAALPDAKAEIDRFQEMQARKAVVTDSEQFIPEDLPPDADGFDPAQFGDEQPVGAPKFAVRPSPGQRGLLGISDDVPQKQERGKEPPRQASMFGGEMLQGVEARVTEGREADGPLFAKGEERGEVQTPMFGEPAAPESPVAATASPRSNRGVGEILHTAGDFDVRYAGSKGYEVFRNGAVSAERVAQIGHGNGPSLGFERAKAEAERRAAQSLAPPTREKAEGEGKVARESEKTYLPNGDEYSYPADRAEARRQAYDAARQLGLDFGRESRAGAVRSISEGDRLRGVEAGSGVRTTALAVTLPEELSRRGWIDLRGHEVRQPSDLAVLARVLRDPRYETFRVFYTKGGKIVAHEGVTSRVPDMAQIVPAPPKNALYSAAHPWRSDRAMFELRDRMSRLQADGYYLLHNHPSGEPVASAQDIALSRKFAHDVPGFKGHVIVDDTQFGLIDPSLGAPTVHDLPAHASPDEYLVPAMPAEGVEIGRGGRVVASPHDVAAVGNAIRRGTPDSYVSLIYTDSRAKVRAVQEMPKALFAQAGPADNYLRGRKRAFGAGRVFAYVEGADDSFLDTARGLVERGSLHDAVIGPGESRGRVRAVSFRDPAAADRGWAVQPQLKAISVAESKAEEGKVKFATRKREDVIDPDTLPREVLARMSQNLKSRGYDVRGADDVLALLKTGRVFRDGAFTQEDWKAAYESAMGTRENRQAKAKTEKELTPNVDWKAVRSFPTTSEPRKAGYIRPDGALLDMSYGDSRRAEDHRFVGGTAGMQELQSVGYIRWMPEANGLDVGKEPTAQQYAQIRRLAERADGEIVLDLQEGIGEMRGSQETGGGYYNHERQTSLQFPAGTKPEKIVGMIRRFYAGEDIQGGVKFATSQTNKQGFYSQLSRAAEEAKMTAASGSDWFRYLSDPKRAVKQDELKWTGLDDFLRERAGKKVTKDEIRAFLAENEVEVREVVKGKPGSESAQAIEDQIARLDADIDNSPGERRDLIAKRDRLQKKLAALGEERSPTKFQNYTLPGGEHYRELLLTLPQKMETVPDVPSNVPVEVRSSGMGNGVGDWYTVDGRGNWSETKYQSREAAEAAMRQAQGTPPTRQRPKESDTFRSTHYDEPNILAHVRFNDRVDADGKRVLFIEEVQSDWAQKGRREGFKGQNPNKAEIDRLMARQRDLQSESAALYSDLKNSPDRAREDFDPENPSEAYLKLKERRLAVESEQKRNEQKLYELKNADRDAVPSAPFVDATEKWTGLALKRMLRYGVENGYDRIAFTPGAIQFQRYGSERFDWKRRADGTWDIFGTKQAGGEAGGFDLEAEARNRNLSNEGKQIVTSKEDLQEFVRARLEHPEDAPKVAGRMWERMQTEAEGTSMPRKEGMEGYYDKIIPQILNRFSEKMKWGARVGETRVETPARFGNNERAVYTGPPVTEAILENLARRGPSADVRMQADRALADVRGGVDPKVAVEKNGAPVLGTALGGKIEFVAAQESQRVHALDITPQMRASVMEGQSQFRAAEPAKTQALTPQHVQRAFPTANVKPREDGSILVDLPNGSKIVVKQNAEIAPDAETLKKDHPDSVDEDGNLLPGMGITGAFQPLKRDGIIYLAKEGGDDFTLRHESFHAAMHIALNEKERAAVLKHFRKEGMDEGAAEEAASDAYAAWKPSQVNGYFSKILAFFKRIYRSFSPSWESAFERTASGEAYGRRNSPEIPDGSTRLATAFHGSPHDFESFDSSKIGTGEGNQAYGYGLYYASAREVAESYRKNLSEPKVRLDGGAARDFAALANDPALSREEREVVNALINDGETHNIQKELARRVDRYNMAALNSDQTIQDIGEGATGGNKLRRDTAQEQLERYLKLEEASKSLQKRLTPERGGKLYEVDLSPSEDEYLLWDKPLSKQSPKVRAALEKIGVRVSGSKFSDAQIYARAKRYFEDGRAQADAAEDIGMRARVRDGYKAFQEGPAAFREWSKNQPGTGWVMQRMLGPQAAAEVGNAGDFYRSFDTPAKASQRLREAGVPGIKYLDGSSRNKPLRDIKREFLNELPENASVEDVTDLIGTGKFSPQNDAILKALQDDDWLGFDYPAQAVSAALSGKLSTQYDASPALLKAVAAAQDGGTFNYVIFDDSLVKVKAKYATRKNQQAAKFATAPAMPPQTPRPGAGQAQPAPGLAVGPETLGDKLIRNIQDKFIRPKRFVEAAGVRDTSQDFYRAEELFHGRTEERLKDAEKKFADPLIKELATEKVQLAQLDQFLYAKHAPTRNKIIEKRTDGKVTDGSGMSDAEAQKILADFQMKGLTPKLDKLAAQVRVIRDEQVKVLLNGGLISKAQAKAWETTFGPDYVPLRTMEVDEGIGTGQGFDIRGKEAKSATGRGSRADSPTTFMLAQLQKAIVRAEKNKVAQTFAEFAQKHPDPALWEFDKAHTKKTLDKSGKVADVQDWKAYQEDFDYKDNGETKRITIKDPLLLSAMKNMGAEKTGEFLRKVGNLTRMYSSLVTSYSPEFILTNPVRDIQAAVANVTAEQSGKIAAQMVRNVPAAVRGMYQSLRDPKATGVWAIRAKEFREDGGSVGFYSVKPADQLAKDIESRIKGAGPGTAAAMKRGAIGIRSLVEDANKAMENGTRLAVYSALRDAGATREKAASVAKNVTLNFNRKGEVGPAVNALYAFANANVQGTKRLIDVAVNNPKGRLIAGSIASLGLTLDLYNRSVAGDKNDDGTNDYDDIPEYVKDRNLVFMRPNGKPFLFPMPYGFNTLITAGRQVGAMSQKAVTPQQAAVSVASSLYNAFNPLGGEDDLVQIASPTFLDPLVQHATNKNFAGKNIRPTQFPGSPQKPDSEMYFKNVSPWARDIAATLNKGTGGDKVTPGYIDVSPETIQHFYEFATGGMGRFLGNTTAVGQQLAEGKGVSIRNVPFARRFQYEEHAGQTGQKYRANVDEMETIWGRYRSYYESKDTEGLKSIPMPMLRAKKQIDAIDGQIRRLKKSLSVRPDLQKQIEQLQIRANKIAESARKASEV